MDAWTTTRVVFLEMRSRRDNIHWKCGPYTVSVKPKRSTDAISHNQWSVSTHHCAVHKLITISPFNQNAPLHRYCDWKNDIFPFAHSLRNNPAFTVNYSDNTQTVFAKYASLKILESHVFLGILNQAKCSTECKPGLLWNHSSEVNNHHPNNTGGHTLLQNIVYSISGGQ